MKKILIIVWCLLASVGDAGEIRIESAYSFLKLAYPELPIVGVSGVRSSDLTKEGFASELSRLHEVEIGSDERKLIVKKIEAFIENNFDLSSGPLIQTKLEDNRLAFSVFSFETEDESFLFTMSYVGENDIVIQYTKSPRSNQSL